jgi:hypothetical protein
MGNADAWLVTGLETSPNEQVTQQQLAVRAWSLAQLSTEDISFIQQFQPTIELVLEADKKLLCFHGSPYSFDDIILPDTSEDVLRQLLSGFDATLLAGGHTHTQQWRRLGNAWYFNPGSVGFAYNWQLSKEQFRADPRAEYAIVSCNGESTGITFRRILLDIEELARIIRASGKPNAEQDIAMYAA